MFDFYFIYIVHTIHCDLLREEIKNEWMNNEVD